MKKLLIFVCCGMGCGLNGMNMDHFSNAQQNINNYQQNVDDIELWLQSPLPSPISDWNLRKSLQENSQQDTDDIELRLQSPAASPNVDWNSWERFQENSDMEYPREYGTNLDSDESSQENTPQNINNEEGIQENILQNINIPRKKGKFSQKEIAIMQEYYSMHGDKNLQDLADLLWRPLRHVRGFVRNNIGALKCFRWTPEEDDRLIYLQQVYGTHWKEIADNMPGRTKLEVMNRFAQINKRQNNRNTQFQAQQNNNEDIQLKNSSNNTEEVNWGIDETNENDVDLLELYRSDHDDFWKDFQF